MRPQRATLEYLQTTRLGPVPPAHPNLFEGWKDVNLHDAVPQDPESIYVDVEFPSGTWKPPAQCEGWTRRMTGPNLTFTRCTMDEGHAGKFHNSAGAGRWRMDGKGEFEYAVDIIKTWPADMNPRSVYEIFRSGKPKFSTYFFTLGRGMPKKPIGKLWFCWRGRILCYFRVQEIIVNDGSLPRLHRLDGGESDWQMRPDAIVAICDGDAVPLREKLYYSGFRGYRYFDLDQHRVTPGSRMPI